MSLIVAGVIAAAVAGVGGLAALARRRRRARAAPPPRRLEAAEPERPAIALAAAAGDVLQHGTHTRWPRGGVMVRDGDELVCAVLLSRENGKDQATVALAPPARHILWLDAVELDLPPSAPARVEIAGNLLDRRRCFPATLEAEGEVPDGALGAIDGQATFAIYEGSVGDAALVLSGASTRIWYGARLDEGDYDNLGSVADEG
jgi:hypothetical protein